MAHWWSVGVKLPMKLPSEWGNISPAIPAIKGHRWGTRLLTYSHLWMFFVHWFCYLNADVSWFCWITKGYISGLKECTRYKIGEYNSLQIPCIPGWIYTCASKGWLGWDTFLIFVKLPTKFTFCVMLRTAGKSYEKKKRKHWFFSGLELIVIAAFFSSIRLNPT